MTWRTSGRCRTFSNVDERLSKRQWICYGCNETTLIAIEIFFDSKCFETDPITLTITLFFWCTLASRFLYADWLKVGLPYDVIVPIGFRMCRKSNHSGTLLIKFFLLVISYKQSRTVLMSNLNWLLFDHSWVPAVSFLVFLLYRFEILHSK